MRMTLSFSLLCEGHFCQRYHESEVRVFLKLKIKLEGQKGQGKGCGLTFSVWERVWSLRVACGQ